MRETETRADFCVIGGGMAGMIAAIAAARRGLRVVLMHDRPVLGGNASSEIRMWICGAHGENVRETGILEEIQLDNLYYNTHKTYAAWDAVLFGKIKAEPNITLLLNCSCQSASMDGKRIKSITGRQLTTETAYTVCADYFADCSGDSVLAPLTGAEFRMGREARGEFNEDIEPEIADKKTMGLSCLMQARETDSPKPFRPFPWANAYADDSAFPFRPHVFDEKQNFWWMEIGGEGDSIHGAEKAKEELLKTAYGVWDHIKNRGDHGADNWVLEWVGFLSGKRESRRYVGDHIITQNDVRAGGPFEDIAAYGGWSMDDHHPAGFRHPGKPTVFHAAPSPYGIPYRALYSRNIENLFFAGRNISATHAALSSTRVMATCALLGQAVGTAAALCSNRGLAPAGLVRRVSELQQALMEDDVWLPGLKREISPLCKIAKLSASNGDPEPLCNGVDRPVGKDHNGWKGPLGSWIEYRFDRETEVKGVRLVFDSDLNRIPKNMPPNLPIKMPPHEVPATLVKAFRIDLELEKGEWETAVRVECNFQRLVRVPVNRKARALRFVPESVWGRAEAAMFSMELR